MRKTRAATADQYDDVLPACRSHRRWLLLLVFQFIAAGAGAQPVAWPVAADPAGRAIAEQLAGAVQRRGDVAIQAVYESRDFRPVWFENGQVRGRLEEVVGAIGIADLHGLNPADYRVPVVPGSDASAVAPEEVARLDLLITGAVLRLAADLRDGHFRPVDVDAKWRIAKTGRAEPDWFARAVREDNLGAALDGMAPPHPQYRYLQRALERHLALKAAGGWPSFGVSGPRRLELSDSHPQVTELRARLAVTDGPIAQVADPELFDGDLEAALKRFQRRHGLNDDGILGHRTRSALAVDIDQRIRQLRASMERWRWMPREMGADYVLVNVPAQRLWVYENDEAVLSMRTIVGKYKRQTPTFSSELTYFVLRPKWYVPTSIAVKDLVPKVQRDPEYYRRGSFTVYDRESGERVDPDLVDWSAYGRGREFPFRLVQNAGGGNALGSIKFMFPNPYGVYLHDTSAPSLFRKDDRFFSSGCIRVEKPLELASSVLSRQEPTPPEKVGAMIAAAPVNRHLTLERTMPLYVVYVTAWADEKDAYFYNDFYKRDSKLLNFIN